MQEGSLPSCTVCISVIAADYTALPVDTVLLGRFLRTAQRHVGLSGQVSVLITSNQRMRRLNKTFRGTDKPTDVLSFPAEPGDGKEKIAGDIAISAQIAKNNSKALGHSVESELRVLLLHGLLHLAGYDHEKDAGEMAAMEQQLRAKLKLPASLIERTRSGRVAAAPARRLPRRNAGQGHANGAPRRKART